MNTHTQSIPLALLVDRPKTGQSAIRFNPGHQTKVFSVHADPKGVARQMTTMVSKTH